MKKINLKNIFILLKNRFHTFGKFFGLPLAHKFLKTGTRTEMSTKKNSVIVIQKWSEKSERK